ncbi:MAG: hypothetical protein NC828_05015 [Candidatus Omnitrophica bacterium]|nr:hypothetical protein [Candidatus Omnitrophota bacterium]
MSLGRYRLKLQVDPCKNQPGLIILESINPTTGVYNACYLWVDSAGNLRKSPYLPQNYETDGTILGGGGATYPEVNTYDDLPPASGHAGEIYIVRESSGIWPFNRRRAGMWRSNGTSWVRLGEHPLLENLSNPQSGNYKVTNLWVNTSGKLVVEYDDTPV